MQSKKILTMAQYAMFIAIIFILGLTPLGFIILPFAGITTVHIPVIVGSYKFGVKGGALLGFCFGLTSLLRCFMTPDATAAIILGTGTGFGLINLGMIICVLFLPRILVGVFSALTYQGLKKAKAKEPVAMAVSAVVGSLTNSVLYLGGLILFAYQQVAEGFYQLSGYTPWVVIATVAVACAVNIIAEAAAAVLICTPVGSAIKHFGK